MILHKRIWQKWSYRIYGKSHNIGWIARAKDKYSQHTKLRKWCPFNFWVNGYSNTVGNHGRSLDPNRCGGGRGGKPRFGHWRWTRPDSESSIWGLASRRTLVGDVCAWIVHRKNNPRSIYSGWATWRDLIKHPQRTCVLSYKQIHARNLSWPSSLYNTQFENALRWLLSERLEMFLVISQGLSGI